MTYKQTLPKKKGKCCLQHHQIGGPGGFIIIIVIKKKIIIIIRYVILIGLSRRILCESSAHPTCVAAPLVLQAGEGMLICLQAGGHLVTVSLAHHSHGLRVRP